MRTVVRVLVLCGLLALTSCSVQQAWGDDHLVLSELQLLDDNDLWVELFSFPAQPATCNVATCQNVVSGSRYEITGDADQAKVAALNELLQTWVLVSEADPFAQQSSDFQLREDIAIGTSTGTAFLTVRFVEGERRFGPDSELVPHAIIFSVTSDSDPAWFEDAVMSLGAGIWVAVALTSLTLLAAVWYLLRRVALRAA